MKNILTLILSIISLNLYSQFELSYYYTTNDTTDVYVDSLKLHFNLDLSNYEYMTYSDSIYDVLTKGEYHCKGYHCLKYGDTNPKIMFLNETYWGDGPKSEKGYVLIEEIDYVNSYFGRDRTTIYIFD